MSQLLIRPVFTDFSAFSAAQAAGDFPQTDESQTMVIVRHGFSIFNAARDTFHGSQDSPLVVNGMHQAEDLGRFLDQHFVFDSARSSDQSRAIDTAKIALSQMSAQPRRPFSMNALLRETEPGLFDAVPRGKDKNEAWLAEWLSQHQDPYSAAGVVFRIKSNSLTPLEMQFLHARVASRLELVRQEAQTRGLSVDELMQEFRAHHKEMDFAVPGGESYLQGEQRAHDVVDLWNSVPAGTHFIVSHGLFISMMLYAALGIETMSRKDYSGLKHHNAHFNVLYRARKSEPWQLLVHNAPPKINLAAP